VIDEFREILIHALMITGFVFSMMLFIEYVNVITKGEWQNRLKNTKIGQLLLGVSLGIIPGCLGSFTVVSLYSHGVISFGTLTATMIASTGDEAYVMLSLFPKTALLITGIIFIIGFVAGYLIDKFYKNQSNMLPDHIHNFEIHEHDWCDCRPNINQIKMNINKITFARGLLIFILSIIFISTITEAIALHEHAESEPSWIPFTVAIVTMLALFVVVVVPEHFLEDHLWNHVLKKHLLRIFSWTFGALLVVHYAQDFIVIESFIKDNYFSVLLIAVTLGLIPESGPHLVFITLFAGGNLPLGILLASSIVQDGHGTLPLIPFSKKSFIYLKLINAFIGFAAGSIYYFLIL